MLAFPDALYTVIKMSMDVFKAAMDVYVSYKFGGLLSSTSAVNAAHLYSNVYSRHQSALRLIHLRLPGAARLCFAATR